MAAELDHSNLEEQKGKKRRVGRCGEAGKSGACDTVKTFSQREVERCGGN